MPIPFIPTTKTQLQTAVTGWISNATTATVANGDINTWDVSAITDMSSLFANKTTFNSNIGGWIVSQVTNMSSMFSGASAFNQSLDAWNVSNVTNMTNMFSFASAFNQSLDAWNVSNVTNTSSMFNRASAFNQPLNSWNVSQVTDMNNMFSVTAVFNQPLGSWNVSNVTNTRSMFTYASAFDQDLSSWNVSNVTNMSGMFAGASSFNRPLNSWNVSNVVNMSDLFNQTSSFNQPINSWIVSNVTNMCRMFYNATVFNQPINSWNVGKVTDMTYMFSNASAFNQDIRTWNVGQSTDLDNMFSGAQAMIDNQGASATPTTAYMNQAPQPPTGPALMPVAFVLPTLNASLELSAALSIVGNYTAPAPFALPTVTLQMHASQFNEDLFHLELVDSNIHTLTDPATEAAYFSEQIRYHVDHTKFPELKSIGNKHLRELGVVNGSAHASTHLRQRNAGVDGLGASIVHELAYQLTGISLMDDQIANGAVLKNAIDNYLNTSLPAFVKSKLSECHGKTQNISGASDMTDQRNVPRELFMQIVKSVVGDKLGTHSAKSSRLNTLFHASNHAGGNKYGIKFIAGDTLRFTVTISPSAIPVDYIVDGMPHAAQEARTVELIITMM